MNNVIKRSWRQGKMVQIEDLRGMAFQAEEAAHTFQISGVNASGETVPLSGSVGAIFLRADNTDVAITGTVMDGVASITLPEECYDMPGRFSLTVYLTSEEQKVAIYAAIGSVSRTSSGNVSPGTSESVADLIDAINAAIQDLEEAIEDIPEDYSDLEDDVDNLKSAFSVLEDNLEGKIQWSETAVSLLMQILDKAVYSQDTSAKRELLSEELEYVPVTGWTITNVLTGITTSNTNTAIQDGASYTATLTATDQSKYVGEITVTMNSIDISDTVVNDNVITIPAVTGDLVIRCSAVVRYNLVPSIANAPNITTFVYGKNTYAYSIVYENESSISGGILHCTVEPNKMTDFNVSIWLLDANGDPYKYTSFINPQNKDVAGAWEPVYSNPGEGASYPTCAGSFDVEIPEGCKVFAWIRTSGGTVIDTEHLTDDTAKRNWALNGGVTFVLEG